MRHDYSYLVVGCGSIGKRHIRNLQRIGRTVSAYESDTNLLHGLSADFPGVHFYSDLGDALNAMPHIAMVCTPPHTHVEIARSAAERGCHLFIEKPLSNSLDGIDLLNKTVQEKKLITLVGCNMRFQYGIQRLRELSRQVGRIYSIRCQFGQFLPDWRPGVDYTKNYSARPEMGGGIVLDAIHEFDYVLWLMGRQPARVSAFTSQSGLLDIEVEDNAGILIQFDDGAIGEIHVDYLSRIYRRACDISGERGVLCWDEMAQDIRIYNAGDKTWQVEKEPHDYDFNESYIQEIMHLEDCISFGTRTISSIHDAKRVLEVALAAKESALTGKHIPLEWRSE